MNIERRYELGRIELLGFIFHFFYSRRERESSI